MATDNGRLGVADRATQASPEPASSLGHSVSVPDAQRVQRWFRSFDSAPRDGTPFHTCITVRFNPHSGYFEALHRPPGGEIAWAPIEIEFSPTWWCRKLPLPYELPKWFSVGLTVTYEAQTKSRMDRLREWAWNKMPECWRDMAAVLIAAQAIEARRAETGTGSVHESAVPTGDAPKVHP
jgi:hypothetical protein